MADSYQLSDGTFVEVPEGTSAVQAKGFVDQAEGQLAKEYGAQATAQNAPVTAGSKVYSATTTYPNTYMGQAMAWLDHNAGGNWMNRNIVQPANAYTGGAPDAIAGTLGRAESNAVSWPVDLPSAVYNTIKHYTPAGHAYDAPYLGAAIRSETGTPELSANAPFPQRAGEAALSAWMSPGVGAGPSFINSLVGGTLGTLSSAIGGYFGGEGGALLGGLFGAAHGSPAEKMVAKGAAIPLRDTGTTAQPDPGAEGTWNAVEAIKPTTPGGNFQGLNQPPLPSLGDLSQFTPSFTALANPSGQRIANSLSSFPFSGKPIEAATEATRNFIQQARNAVASELTAPGGGLPRGEPVSPSTIGPQLTEGSQQAILALLGRERARQDAVDTAMKNQPVPVPGTISEGFNQVSGNQRGQTATGATLSRVGELQSDAPGGANYAGPDVPLPAIPTVPWSNIKDWVGDLNASLAQSGRPALPPDIAAALKTVANQERESAANAVQPGLGTQFRQNNESYARALPVLDRLYRMGGEPLGTTGKFSDVPKEQAAARELTGNLQSPQYLSDVLLHPDFPAANRLNAVGQLVSTLGDQGSSANFRPEKFVTDWQGTGGANDKGARPGVDALSVGPSGAPLATTNVLDNAARVAQNFSTPTSRFGLIKSLGSAATVAKLMEGAAKGIEYATHWKPAEWMGVPLVARGISAALESDPMRRAMANQPQNWADIANAIPTMGAVTGTNPPARHVWVTRP